MYCILERGGGRRVERTVASLDGKTLRQNRDGLAQGAVLDEKKIKGARKRVKWAYI